MSNFDAVMRRLGAFSVAREGYEPPTEARLRRFEEELGGRLPATYREFLVDWGETGLNHGEFALKEPAPGGDSSAVHRFHGVYPDPGRGIEKLTFATYAGRIPDETIPIADAIVGDAVLLGFDGNDAGRVWLWDHEHRELAGRMEEIREDLRGRGKDPDPLEDHAAIWFWERLVPEKVEGRVGFSNLYEIADSFEEFLESLGRDLG